MAHRTESPPLTQQESCNQEDHLPTWGNSLLSDVFHTHLKGLLSFLDQYDHLFQFC